MSLGFRCRCGATAWEIAGAGDGVSAGTLARCYCRDCRAWARALGVADRLEPGGALDVLITRPGRIAVTRGAENLRLMKLSPKGLERWYAGCCDTPVSSHLRGWAPMAGVTAMNAVDPARLGPVRMIYGAASALDTGDPPRRNRGVAAVMLRILGWALPGLVLRRLRATPFPPGTPARVLTREERAALSD